LTLPQRERRFTYPDILPVIHIRDPEREVSHLDNALMSMLRLTRRSSYYTDKTKNLVGFLVRAQDLCSDRACDYCGVCVDGKSYSHSGTTVV